MSEFFLDVTSVVNKEFFLTVKELLTCHICTGIITDPKQCQTCENSFCNKCITTWLTKSKSCPYKCKEVVITDCTRAIRNLLDKLSFICPYECGDYNKEVYSYDNLFKHLKICNKVKVACQTCGSLVSEELIKDSYDVLKLKEELKLLKDLNSKLIVEKIDLSEKYKQLNKKSGLTNNGNGGSGGNNASTNESELGLKDKCQHFKGNYIPLFPCCSKAFPCYICHDIESDHAYEFSNRVICLNCNNIYTGTQCSQCNTFQIYRKK